MTNELVIPGDAPVMRLNTVAPKVVLRINTDGTVELPEGPVEAVREFWRTMYEYRAVLRLALRQARRQRQHANAGNDWRA